MRLFLYEWITGGGLVEESGRLPASLLVEGSAMVSALAADFAAIEGCRVTAFRDMRLHEPALSGCDVVEIHSKPEWAEAIDRAASEADWTLVVAPEFDDILLNTVRRVELAGGKSLNASPEFIALAADKHRTVERLQRAGVPAPTGRILEADAEKLPTDFAYPGVLKPRQGAGSQHTLLVHGSRDEPPPHPWEMRLEQFCPGGPASVAVLCGERQRVALPACWQHLSADGRFTYRGGAIIEESSLAQRAESLAIKALEAMPPSRGYVGVDLVLGDASDGSEDVVIEINPRVTTSYVGLRRAVEQNIGELMLDVARGTAMEVSRINSVDFQADGTVFARPRSPA
jgi:predicted ATP-grasp superfamily ATP-dependent carboligase